MRKPSEAITRKEIDLALRRFRLRGGIIEKVPDERVPKGRLVGARHGTCMALVPQYWNSRA